MKYSAILWTTDEKDSICRLVLASIYIFQYKGSAHATAA